MTDPMRPRGLRKLLADKRGNVLMLFGFAVIPITVSAGIGIDYARAARLQTKLNAAADAAALAAVTQPMMRKTDAEAATVARNMFLSQASNLPGLVFDPSIAANLVVTITATPGAVSSRRAQVTYQAASNNAFSGILKMNTLPLRGTSESRATIAPNIDFYLMLDTSPSMALPATSAGIDTMVNKTGGCAFACHQTDVSGAETVVHNSVRMSYLSYARSQNLSLRTDLVSEAVKDLADVAVSTGAQNGATYRMALSQFSYRYDTIVAAPTTPATVRSQAANATLLPYCRNNQRICGVGDNDQATNFTAAFTGAMANMPAISGYGTPTIGDTPQSMLFIVTDGMRDEDNGGRKMGPIPTAQCDAIKARGIRIAVLYTEYLASAASDSWSISNVRTPYLAPTDRISPALQACASTGLYYKVTTDGDISAALTALFRQAISTPRLLQ